MIVNIGPFYPTSLLPLKLVIPVNAGIQEIMGQKQGDYR
jgi:hypothetical protein